MPSRRAQMKACQRRLNHKEHGGTLSAGSQELQTQIAGPMSSTALPTTSRSQNQMRMKAKIKNTYVYVVPASIAYT